MAVAATYQVTGGISQFRNPECAIAAFEAWGQSVQATVPPERLLVFEVSQGWEPLCAFLGKPVPSVPFPRINEGTTFQDLLADQRRAATAKLLSAGLLIIGLVLGLLLLIQESGRFSVVAEHFSKGFILMGEFTNSNAIF